MTAPELMKTCPDCGHEVRRPTQDRCTECGLQWDDWLDRESDRIRMRTRDWLLVLVVFPVIAAIPPLLVGRGAIMGARTFEASYYLTIPAFAGIIVLSWFFARPVVWWIGRRGRTRRDGVARPPGVSARVAAFMLLFLVQVVLYLVVIRLGFVFFVEPLRPVPQQAPLSTATNEASCVPARSTQASILTQNQV